MPYDRSQSYRWNYDNPPDPVDVEEPAVDGDWTFCGLPVPSPLGIPAGPLLNGRWVLYYAAFGFDVLTYKTVRSVQRDCYPLPNLVPVNTERVTGDETEVAAIDAMRGSWAVSFGMPSAEPQHWRDDVEWTRDQLRSDKLLCVSVVGSIQDGWSLDDLADDYATCARWAVESGADVVEANFSCPNVSTCDGQLYQQPSDAAIVAARVRSVIGTAPFCVKIGHVRQTAAAEELFDALKDHVSALAMTNSVAAVVRARDGELIFGGERRGICGRATLAASIEQVAMFREIAVRDASPVKLIGVGGAATADDVGRYRAAGAEHVQIATAAMTEPPIGLQIRQSMSRNP